MDISSSRQATFITAVLVTLAACSGGGNDAADPSVDPPPASDASADATSTETESTPGESDATAPDVTSPDVTPPATDNGGPAPLGFATSRFEVPVPEVSIPEPPPRIADNAPTTDAAVPVAPMFDGTGAFDTIDELIDSGITAGVWTEIEAVRAIISVVMGELPPETVAGFDDVFHPSIRGVLDRAEALLDDDSVDSEQQQDLARLTAFFFEPDPTATDGPPDADATVDDGPEGLRGPQAFAARRTAVRVQTGCVVGRTISEDSFFEAQYTNRQYCEARRGEDRVLFPVAQAGEGDIWERSATRFLDIIDRARTGYEQLVNTTMPKVYFLISPRPDPEGVAAGHVVTGTNAKQCRGAIFATGSLMAQDAELDNTMAHELFHCVQGAWPGEFSGVSEEFFEEAGASYFAYQLLGECAPSDAVRGPRLDRDTANGSLLESSYEGWFFWAYLADHGKLPPLRIGELHQDVKSGASAGDAMRTYIPDIDRTMNEFYVRMMGPGLACNFQGWQTTDEREITDTGDVSFADSAWQGTRYEVTYPSQRYFAQTAGDGLPIGMAEPGKSPSEAAWVTVEPEIRTECDDDEDWYVVLAIGGSENTPVDRKLTVTERQDPQCDPCPIGAWAFDLQDLSEFFEDFAPPGQPAVDISIGGTWTLEFAAPKDGQSVVGDNQNTVITFSTDAGAFSSTVSGVGQGTWTGNESSFQISNYSSTTTASIFGASSTASSTDADQAAYTCEDDTMTITLENQQVGLTRIDPVEGDPYFS